MSFIIALLSTLIWSLALLLTLRLKRPEIKADVKHAKGDLVSIIIPARNEEYSITRCLNSLLSQDYQNIELIVVDDQSEDRTAELVAEISLVHPNVKIISGPDVMPGWIGKNLACIMGARDAKGGWLLFLDADSELSPNLVSTAISHAEEEGLDVLSLMPRIAPMSRASSIIFPVLGFLIRIFYPIRLINAGKGRVFFYGGFTLFRKEAYWEIGGHESVKGEIVEDKALAEKARRYGLKIRVLTAKRLFHSRVGGATIPELWFSVQRIISGAFKGRRLQVLLFALMLPFFFWLPYLSLVLAIAEAGFNSTLLALVSIAMFLSTLYTDVSVDQAANPLYTLLTPMGSLFIGTSALHWVLLRPRELAWKGRIYRTN